MNERQPLTRNIAKKGFSGMRSSSPASISVHLDSDVLRNPFQAILPTLATIAKKHRAMMKVKIYKLATQELNHPSLQPSLRGLTLASRSTGQIIY